MFDRAMLNKLFRYCKMLCEQDCDALDLLQNGVERCLKSPPEYEKATYSYATRVIRNAYIDDLRRQNKQHVELFDETLHTVDYDVANLERIMIDKSELEVIWPVLSITEKEILFLWAIEGYSTSEIAEHLDKSRNSILSIIHRMRKRLCDKGYIDQSVWEVA